MKRKLVMVCAVFFLLAIQPAFARNNACILSSQAVGLEPAQLQDFFRQKVVGRLLTGQGKLLKIKQTGGDGGSGSFVAIISCSEKVLVIIQTDEFGVKKARAKQGAMVSFTGESTKMYKSHGIVYCHMKATIR